MADHTPFTLHDCGLARLGQGTRCATLDDLLKAVRDAPELVIEHHMMRCVLEDHFELYEFPNDLALWCWDSLGDHVLGERLGIVDPYRHPSLDSLRQQLATLIADRIAEQDVPLVCRPGHELHLTASRLIAYRTGEEFATPVELAEQIGHFTLPSLFYHVHEARRRSDGRTDDFSLWLEGQDADPGLVAAIRKIDFYFLNLRQLRDELVRAFHEFMPIVPAAAVS